MSNTNASTIVRKHFTINRAADPNQPELFVHANSRQRWLKMATEDVDRAGDRLLMSGLDANDFLRNPQFLWMHGRSGESINTIGVIRTLDVHNGALYALAEYADPAQSELAEKIYRMDLGGLLPANSIGFRPIEFEANEFGGFDFLKWQLIECSKVELPMNPHAVDDGAPKAMTLEDADDWLVIHNTPNQHQLLLQTDTMTLTNDTLNCTRDEFTSLVDKALDRKLRAMPDRSTLKALTNDKPQSNAEREKVLKTFRFFHAVAQNDHAELRAIQSSYDPEYVKLLNPQVEGTNSAGGYLVPPEFYADVIEALEKYGFAREYCSIIPMKSNVLNVSTLTGTPSVSWTSENGTIAASKASFGRLTLTAQKLAAIYPISNELLQDANIDVYRAILGIFVEVFAQEEDTQIFRGTGSPFTGILNTAGVTTTYLGGASNSTKTKYTDITLDDLINLVQSIGPAQQRGASLFIEQNTLTDLLKKKDSQSRYLWDLAQSNDPGISGVNGLRGTGLSFRGYPVVSLPNGVLIDGYDTSDHASTPFAIFGNLKTAGCWLGQHGGFEMRVSHDATADGVNAFTNDLQMLRLTERIAFGVGQPAYLAVLSTSAT